MTKIFNFKIIAKIVLFLAIIVIGYGVSKFKLFKGSDSVKKDISALGQASELSFNDFSKQFKDITGKTMVCDFDVAICNKVVPKLASAMTYFGPLKDSYSKIIISNENVFTYSYVKIKSDILEEDLINFLVNTQTVAFKLPALLDALSILALKVVRCDDDLSLELCYEGGLKLKEVLNGVNLEHRKYQEIIITDNFIPHPSQIAMNISYKSDNDYLLMKLFRPQF